MAKWIFVVPVPSFLAPVRRVATRAWKRVKRLIVRKKRVRRVLDLPASAPAIDGDERTVESRIVDGLDAGALFLLRLLQDESRDPETNALNVDFKQRLDAFKALNDYLVKRQKAKENGLEDGDGMPPYEKIRRWLDEMGFEIVPKKKVGRPTKEELELRKKVLGEPEKPEAAPEEPHPEAPDSAMQERLRELSRKAGAVNVQA